MPKLSFLLLVAIAAVSAIAAYNMAERTQAMESKLQALRAAVSAEQEALHVTKAEWSYLTRPARIADLAERHLGYTSIGADHFIESSILVARPDLLMAEYNRAFTDKDPGP